MSVRHRVMSPEHRPPDADVRLSRTCTKAPHGMRCAEKARMILALVIATAAAEAAAAYDLGRQAILQERFDQAVHQLERATELQPDNALFHYWLGAALRDEAQRASKLRAPFIARRMKGA